MTWRVWSPENQAALRAMAANGKRKREAAEAFGVSFSTIQKTAARYGITFHGKAAKNPNSRRWANRPIAQPKPAVAPINTDDIARYIAERGVTRCPPAYAAPSPQGART